MKFFCNNHISAASKMIFGLWKQFLGVEDDFRALKAILNVEKRFERHFGGSFYVFQYIGFCIAPLCGFLGTYKNQKSPRKSFWTSKTGLKGILEAHFTFSNILEFVSRHYAGFSGGTKIRGNFEVHFTFSTYMEFVKRAKKNPSERSEGGKNFF